MYLAEGQMFLMCFFRSYVFEQKKVMYLGKNPTKSCVFLEIFSQLRFFEQKIAFFKGIF